MSFVNIMKSKTSNAQRNFFQTVAGRKLRVTSNVIPSQSDREKEAINRDFFRRLNSIRGVELQSS